MAKSEKYLYTNKFFPNSVIIFLNRQIDILKCLEGATIIDTLSCTLSFVGERISSFSNHFRLIATKNQCIIHSMQ